VISRIPAIKPADAIALKARNFSVELAVEDLLMRVSLLGQNGVARQMVTVRLFA